MTHKWKVGDEAFRTQGREVVDVGFVVEVFPVGNIFYNYIEICWQVLGKNEITLIENIKSREQIEWRLKKNLE